MKYHLIPVKLAIDKMTENQKNDTPKTHTSKGVTKRRTFSTTGGNVNWYSSYANCILESPQNKSIRERFRAILGSNSPTAGYTPKENKVRLLKRHLHCLVLFIASLFIMAKRYHWFIATNRKVDKMWYICCIRKIYQCNDYKLLKINQL